MCCHPSHDVTKLEPVGVDVGGGLQDLCVCMGESAYAAMGIWICVCVRACEGVISVGM